MTLQYGTKVGGKTFEGEQSGFSGFSSGLFKPKGASNALEDPPL